jgi:hypothetical protein
VQKVKERLKELQLEALSQYPIGKQHDSAERREFMSFGGVDIEMLSLFIKMDSPIEFIEFERWLLKVWKTQN